MGSRILGGLFRFVNDFLFGKSFFLNRDTRLLRSRCFSSSSRSDQGGRRCSPRGSYPPLVGEAGRGSKNPSARIRVCPQRSSETLKNKARRVDSPADNRLLGGSRLPCVTSRERPCNPHVFHSRSRPVLLAPSFGRVDRLKLRFCRSTYREEAVPLRCRGRGTYSRRRVCQRSICTFFSGFSCSLHAFRRVAHGALEILPVQTRSSAYQCPPGSRTIVISGPDARRMRKPSSPRFRPTK